MAEKVKLSKDGNSIDFVQSDNLPTSLKKFRQSPEIEGFYRFVYENDLQKEAFDILERIVMQRKATKKAQKLEQTQTKKAEQVAAKEEAAAQVKAAAAKKAAAKSVPGKPAAKTIIKKAAAPAPKAKAAPAKPVKKAAPAPAKKAKKK